MVQLNITEYKFLLVKLEYFNLKNMLNRKKLPIHKIITINLIHTSRIYYSYEQLSII